MTRKSRQGCTSFENIKDIRSGSYSCSLRKVYMVMTNGSEALSPRGNEAETPPREANKVASRKQPLKQM